MNHFKYLTILLLGLVLSSCGGGGNNSLTGGGVVPGASNVTSIQVVSSAPTLQTDQTGTASVTISAIVRDQSNNVVEGVDLLFSATSGSIEEVDGGITNAAGVAEVLLKSFGNVQNRAITVTVQDPASGVSRAITVNVVGTTLTLSGPSAVAQGDPAPFTLSLRDGQGVGIPGEVITLTSANGNNLSNPAPITGVSGEAQIIVTANGTAGDDTITATALGITTTVQLSVSDDIFAFTSPAAGAEIGLSPIDSTTATVQWQQNGSNVPDGSTIEFTADRGTLSAGSAVTTGGFATIDIESGFAGRSTITATGASIGGAPISNGPSTQLTIEFIAETPDTINLSAFPDLLITGEQSTLTAVVKDASGNRVKGINVDFNIVSDSSGGQLTVSSDITDSQGTASTIYTAGQSTTEKDGVTISATVRGTAISSIANLTVSGRSINFVVGTGNDIFEISSTRYGVQWTVTATDVAGVPAAGQDIRLTVRNTHYSTGEWYVDDEDDRWIQDTAENPNSGGSTPQYFCPDEDWVGNGGNENGSLDLSPFNEDDDADGDLDSPNIAVIVAALCEEVADAEQGQTQQSLSTDVAGNVEVCIVYPQEFAEWTDVRFTATVPIDGGTEVVQSRFFRLPISAEDVNNTEVSPPGRISPYGRPQASPHAGCLEIDPFDSDGVAEPFPPDVR
ncbi:MAG: hypothetical protein V2J12_09455 [Gammaproteobacteria bacterium]|jgi:hypothetical protein|nr:hypothetical protein [Gammaproteobacteria bacterium]